MTATRTCARCGAPLNAESALDVCPRCVAAQVLASPASPTGADATAGPAGAGSLNPANLEQPGDRIGRYKILERIGEGGCGVVYVAEQEEPVRRRVALKLIKPGMDTKSVIARFEAERQALAMMDHPNIAKVLDGGATDSGRPYFVMELVRGVRITEYCDDNHLSTGRRLDLFTQVCQAVQHAHQKGIIHRDLKPSNILVTINDGAPAPKVIDFGIAKAVEGRLTDLTVYTELHQFIGTPAYMSPEQALMTSLDIDTRSDIYSLGVLLYELLTGRTPLDTREMLKAGVDELRRTIREVEPPRPSRRLSTLAREDLTTAARRRSTEAPKLIHSVSGDLDWIVMKALEKDRARRYETANGLAADIQRHLKNKPVVARPPSAAYRFQKAFKRNKVALTAAGAVAAALVIGLGVSMWQAIENGKSYRRAQMEAAKSQTVAKFHKGMLEGMKPSIAMGRDTTLLREFADQTFKKLESGLSNEPVVEMELRAALGRVYLALGDFSRAESLYREALPRMRNVLSGEQPDLADFLQGFAEALNGLGRGGEAEPLAREALALNRKVYGEEHPTVARSLLLLGNSIARKKAFHKMLYYEGDIQEAEAVVRQSLSMFQKLNGPEHQDVAIALDTLGSLVALRGGREGEAMTRQALAMTTKMLGDTHPLVITFTMSLAGYLQDRPDEQVALLRELLAKQRKLLGDENRMVAHTLATLSGTLFDNGRRAEAEPLARESLALQRKLHGGQSIEAAFSAGDLGVILMDLKRYDEAEPLLREGAAILKKSASDPVMLLVSIQNLGLVLLDQGKHAEAEATFREQIALVRTLGTNAPARRLAEALGNLANAMRPQNRQTEFGRFLDDLIVQANTPAELTRLLITRGDYFAGSGRWNEAGRDFARAIELSPDDHENYHKLAPLLVQAGDLVGYRKHCRQEVEQFRETKDPNIAERMAKDCLILPDSGVDLNVINVWTDLAVAAGKDSGDLPWFQHAKGLAEYRSGRFAEAAEWAGKALEKAGDDYRDPQATSVLAMSQHRLGQTERARATLARALELGAKLPKAESGDIGEGWLDWIIARALVREAKGLIEPRSK